MTLPATTSKSQKKKLKANNETLKVKSHLIGQLGKNENIPDNPLNLKIILEEAYSIIDQARSLIGGRVIILECQDLDRLICLYQDHSFQVLETVPDNESDVLITMYDVIKG